MNIVVIYAHPYEGTFCKGILDKTVEHLESRPKHHVLKDLAEKKIHQKERKENYHSNQKMSKTSVTVLLDGEIQEISCDSIVLAMGVNSNNALYEELKEKENVVLVGGGQAPANALSALRQGYVAGINA